jgi:hypothetical protein
MKDGIRTKVIPTDPNQGKGSIFELLPNLWILGMIPFEFGLFRINGEKV